ncbi:MAG: hypothetical protein ACREDK_00750 [Thermoplasmata archaeon]
MALTTAGSSGLGTATSDPRPILETWTPHFTAMRKLQANERRWRRVDLRGTGLSP